MGRCSSPRRARRSGRRSMSFAVRMASAPTIRAVWKFSDADLGCFRDALVRESHTIKRALTDPHLLSGIGNAYSDEILHAARLSPVKLAHSKAYGRGGAAPIRRN